MELRTVTKHVCFVLYCREVSRTVTSACHECLQQIVTCALVTPKLRPHFHSFEGPIVFLYTGISSRVRMFVIIVARHCSPHSWHSRYRPC